MTVRAPVGYVAKASFECCLGRGVCAIQYKNNYIYYFLEYIEPTRAKLSTGSTFDSINSNILKDTKIIIPQDSKEQNAIAKVLSDIDNHIQNLQTKKKKYEKIKLGMMQKLLTGQIRLV